MSAKPALTALPVLHAPDPVVPALDTVHDGGTVHLVHDSVTPDEARIADLLLVATALEGEGVALTLIRHDRSTPALVVDLADRATVLAALRRLDQHAVSVKAKGRPAVAAGDLTHISSSPSTLRVFRPRITPDRGLRYGAGSAARLEFWRFSADAIVAPSDNALTRRIMAPADVAYTQIERHGRRWRTLEGMFDPQPHEFTDDVDIVFSWVDGSSSEFQRQRAAQQKQYIVGEGDGSAARYRHVDELRYALRSVHMYAPWVRRIFIATDSAAPRWLREHPKVTIVRSEEFFADPGVLPTHNSHAVEAQLHRIPGLSEHFLYSNDDMFFGRPVDPELFFTPYGITKFVECGTRIGVGRADAARSGHDNGLRVNRALLQQRFGRTIVRDLEHCATPLRRSVMAELEEVFADDIARTAASRFRSATDVSVTNSLYHYYALMTGRAVATDRPRVRYVETTSRSAPGRLARLARRRDLDMFCLNDGGQAELPEDVRMGTLRDTLARMFPLPAPWERVDEVSAPERSAPSEQIAAAR